MKDADERDVRHGTGRELADTLAGVAALDDDIEGEIAAAMARVTPLDAPSTDGATEHGVG